MAADPSEGLASKNRVFLKASSPFKRNPIETAPGSIYAILMVFVEGVHRLLLCAQIPCSVQFDEGSSGSDRRLARFPKRDATFPGVSLKPLIINHLQIFEDELGTSKRTLIPGLSPSVRCVGTARSLNILKSTSESFLIAPFAKSSNGEMDVISNSTSLSPRAGTFPLRIHTFECKIRTGSQVMASARGRL